jgi:hypothetical protein
MYSYTHAHTSVDAKAREFGYGTDAPAEMNYKRRITITEEGGFVPLLKLLIGKVRIDDPWPVSRFTVANGTEVRRTAASASTRAAALGPVSPALVNMPHCTSVPHFSPLHSGGPSILLKDAKVTHYTLLIVHWSI